MGSAPGLFQSCGKVIHEGSAMPAEGSLGPGLSHKLVVFSHREQNRWLSLLHGLGMVSYPWAETMGSPTVIETEASTQNQKMPRQLLKIRCWWSLKKCLRFPNFQTLIYFSSKKPIESSPLSLQSTQWITEVWGPCSVFSDIAAANAWERNSYSLWYRFQ